MRMLRHRIAALWERNAYHKKRGFRIQTQSTQKVGVHLVEEATELLAELMEDTDGEVDMAAVTEEAADVVILLTRICFDCDISINDLMAAADRKMAAIWVDDPSEVTAIEPGFTRKGRNDVSC